MCITRARGSRMHVNYHARSVTRANLTRATLASSCDASNLTKADASCREHLENRGHKFCLVRHLVRISNLWLYTGVDWTLIIQELTEHLLYRSWLNTYYTGVDWTLIIQELTEHLLYRSWLNTYYTGVDWTLIIQELTEHIIQESTEQYYLIEELTEHLLYRSWLNTHYTGVDSTLTIQELTEHNYYTRGVETKHLFICRSWLNTNIKTYKSRLNTYYT